MIHAITENNKPAQKIWKRFFSLIPHYKLDLLWKFRTEELNEWIHFIVYEEIFGEKTMTKVTWVVEMHFTASSSTDPTTIF